MKTSRAVVEMIRATPADRRSEFAAEIWKRRRMQHGPPGRSDSVPFQPNPTPTSKKCKGWYVRSMGTFVGFDPGGAGAFGWAVLVGEELALTLVHRGIADHARGAIDGAIAAIGQRQLTALGVDAPLFWQPTGDRRVDQMVRTAQSSAWVLDAN